MNARRKTTGSVRAAMTVVTGLALALGGTGLWFFNGSGSSGDRDADVPLFTVRRGSLPVTLKLKGTFEADKAEDIRADVRGSVKIIWLAEEGSMVKKGGKLVELDPTDIVDEVERLEIQEEQTKTRLSGAEADEVISKLENESNVRKVELDVLMATLEIGKFDEGTGPKEVRDAEIKIREAKVRLIQAKSIDDQMAEMLSQGFVTKEEFEESRLKVQTARNNLETAELEKEILAKFTHPMKKKKLEGDQVRAAAELVRFRKVAERRAEQRKTAVIQSKQAHKRATERLKDARERLAKMVILAPSKGIVVWGGGRQRWWDDEIRVGATAHRRQTIMRLPDLETMQVIVQVHEADYSKIRVDKKNPQPAKITTDSMPGRTFDGYVARVDTLAKGEWGREHVKRFSTTIGVEEQIPGMRPGMTATVEIFIEKLEDALYVPIQAVQTRRGESYCYVAIGGEPEKRAVVVGASNKSFVEIKDGLQEGEKVLIAPPAAEGEPERAKKQSRPKAPYARSRRRKTG